MFWKKIFHCITTEKKEEIRSSPTLYELVADHQNFKGWDAVYQRIQSHPEEVRIPRRGWYPLQHAFYNHPDFPIPPVPVKVVQLFIDKGGGFEAYPIFDVCPIIEACRNPFTLALSLETLLLDAKTEYLNIYAERDFNQLLELKVDRFDLLVTFAKVASRKGVLWENGLLYIITVIQHKTFSPFSPLIDEFLISSLTSIKEWEDGLDLIFKMVYERFNRDKQIELLRQWAEEEMVWHCWAFKYFMSEFWELFSEDDETKKHLLVIGAKSNVHWQDLHNLLCASQFLFEGEDGKLLLQSLLYNACSSRHEVIPLTVVYHLLREFPYFCDYLVL